MPKVGQAQASGAPLSTTTLRGVHTATGAYAKLIDKQGAGKGIGIHSMILNVTGAGLAFSFLDEAAAVVLGPWTIAVGRLERLEFRDTPWAVGASDKEFGVNATATVVLAYHIEWSIIEL